MLEVDQIGGSIISVIGWEALVLPAHGKTPAANPRILLATGKVLALNKKYTYSFYPPQNVFSFEINFPKRWFLNRWLLLSPPVFLVFMVYTTPGDPIPCFPRTWPPPIGHAVTPSQGGPGWLCAICRWTSFRCQVQKKLLWRGWGNCFFFTFKDGVTKKHGWNDVLFWVWRITEVLGDF